MKAHPRSACGASPSRGRHPRPGKAGSAVALGWDVRCHAPQVVQLVAEVWK